MFASHVYISLKCILVIIIIKSVCVKIKIYVNAIIYSCGV